MGMLISTIAALSTFYPDAKDIFNAESRRKQTYRLIGKMPTLAAFAYRHSLGMPYAYPDNELSYAGNFLNMLFKTTELKYRPNPTLERALDVLFILHADHEQNCSANAMRNVGSSHVDPYSACAAATAALYGPLHGGANEEVLRMLLDIGSIANIPAYIKRVKAGEKKLMGFGHRIYKNYDPRARIIKRIADEVFEVMGRNPLLDIALEVERIALRGRLLRHAQALSQRGLLYRADLPVHGLPGDHVPGAVRDSAHQRLDRAVGGDAARPRAEDRASAADLSRLRQAAVRADGTALEPRSTRSSPLQRRGFARHAQRTPASEDAATAAITFNERHP